MAKRAVGIDVGGTGIKGALVDTRIGEIIGDRIRVDTPAGASPAAVAEVVERLVEELAGHKPHYSVGITFPAVVKLGRTLSAANVSHEWIGLEAEAMFTQRLGRNVHMLNDADAAGVAEMRGGAGTGVSGLVILTTLGTGIGSALFYDGVLVPNTELGHLEIDGFDYETQASYAAKERDGLDYAEWAKRLQRYYETLELLFSPDLLIVGGGVSKSHREFLPLLKLRTPIVAAQKRNNAGVIGAALIANEVFSKL